MLQVNQDMLRVARHASGLTQAQVSAKSGLSQGFVSKLENGLSGVDQTDLERLADALDVRPEMLTRRDFARGLPNGMWAKRKTLPARARHRLEGLFNLHKMDVARLSRSVEFETSGVPDCEGQCPLAAARAVRRALRIPSGPVRSITRFVEDAGIPIVQVENVHRKFFGLSVGNEDRHPPIIFINRSLPQEKANYYIAHELMHLALGHGGGGDVEEMEDEADAAAAELLMPEEAIRPDLKAQPITFQRLFALKRKWRVEAQSILKRASVLQLIGQAKATYLWKQFSKRGYRLVEAHPIPTDPPTLLRELLDAHTNGLGYSDEELSSVLGIPVEVMLERYNLPRKKPTLRLVR